MDRRSFGLGVVVGGLAVGATGVAGYLAYEWIEFDGIAVTRDEIQLSAVQAFVDLHGIPEGSDVVTRIEFGGAGCGGVVEMTANGRRQVFLVRQDSGDAFLRSPPRCRSNALGLISGRKTSAASDRRTDLPLGASYHRATLHRFRVRPNMRQWRRERMLVAIRRHLAADFDVELASEFRGREAQHPERGARTVETLAKDVSDLADVIERRPHSIVLRAKDRT